MRTRTWPTVWSVIRLLAAAVIMTAVVGQFVTTVRSAIAGDRDVATTIANFFSFFTILSNLIAVLALLAAVVWFWMRPSHEDREPPGVAVALAGATTYLVITGVVYNLLLRGLPTADDHVAWANEILHVAAPLFLVIDLLVAPTHRALRWRAVAVVLAFPIAWIVYTLIRGPFVTDPVRGVAFWYPYPFLNPNGGAGWGGVWMYVAGIALTFVIVGAIVIGVGRLRARATPTPAPA